MKQKLKTKRYVLETIELNNEDKFVISDPCYKFNDDTIIVKNFLEGKYFLILDVQESPFNTNVYLNESVYLVHEDYMQFPNADNKEERWQGTHYKTFVDSGTLGIFKSEGYFNTHCERFIDKDWYSKLKYNELYKFNGNPIPLNLTLSHDEKSQGIIIAAHDDGVKDVYVETANWETVYVGINLCGNLIIPDEWFYYDGFEPTEKTEETSYEIVEDVKEKFSTKCTIEREYFFYVDGTKIVGGNLPFDVESLPNYQLINMITIDKDKITSSIENIEVHYFKSKNQVENYKKRKENTCF